MARQTVSQKTELIDEFAKSANSVGRAKSAIVGNDHAPHYPLPVYKSSYQCPASYENRKPVHHCPKLEENLGRVPVPRTGLSTGPNPSQNLPYSCKY